ncbi:MAG: pseudouridine-5'-phosphate glycosidase [Pseudomonadota bacterium]
MTDLPYSASPAVAEAMAKGHAVVALESTIITHGMPWPDNVETARAVEDAVRDTGAVPATIAVLDGQLRIGLTDDELEVLGQKQDVMKLSRADLAFAISMKRTGSTTVAATMICAALAGISVFATGGIGGVHRGAEDTFDISADLVELGRTPVTVVCAGAKAILDLPKTFEVLETHGVPVIGYRCDEMPAFWSRESGLPAPLRLDEPEQIARHMADRRRLSLNGGVLVANPVPAEDAIPADDINRHIETALKEASAEGITGKEVTPFLLGRMVTLTDGASLSTNKALILNNAHLAGEIAVAAITISK